MAGKTTIFVKEKNKESKNILKNCESVGTKYCSVYMHRAFVRSYLCQHPTIKTNWLSVFHSSEHDIMAKHYIKLSSSFQQSISQYRRLCYRQNEIVFVVNTSKECVLIEIPDSFFWFLSMKDNDDKPDFTDFAYFA